MKEKRIGYKKPTGSIPWTIIEIPLRGFRKFYQVWDGKNWRKVYFIKAK